ncbi:MAG: cytidylate kinase-like family protein [Verrucomicrobia bacterium]|nr:MAG: cytidylate kinase-like family protein [Verrucomicrobiota bacterium]
MTHPSQSLERAKSYLNLQLTRTPQSDAFHPPEEGPYVTISREAGAGAPEFAQSLADHLNAGDRDSEVQWTVFDQKIVEHVLQDQNLSPTLARFLPEDRIPHIISSLGEIIGLHPNLWTLVQRTNAFMRELARRGHVILVGRGANFATAGIRGGVHCRLVAPEHHRACRVSAEQNIDLEEAHSVIRRIDSARRHYVRSVFDTDVADPTAYDIVINTARVPFSQSIEVIARLVEHARATAAAR